MNIPRSRYVDWALLPSLALNQSLLRVRIVRLLHQANLQANLLVNLIRARIALVVNLVAQALFLVQELPETPMTSPFQTSHLGITTIS